jgi:hypothetical protein
MQYGDKGQNKPSLAHLKKSNEKSLAKVAVKP